MADAVAYRAAFGRIGLNAHTQLAVNANGFYTTLYLIARRGG
jgi:hypothetical protein